PLADHEGYLPNEVNCRSAPPCAGTTNKPPPSRSERKTMLLPSGDQAGSVSWAADFVSCRAWFPSRGCTQTSKFPARSDTYAIDRPSGENVASVCRPGSNVIRVSGRSTGTTDAAVGAGPARRPTVQTEAAIATAAPPATRRSNRARRDLS